MNKAFEFGHLRTLASLLNVSEAEAAPLLASKIQITWDISDAAGKALGEFTARMLGRTFESIGTPTHPDLEAAYELSINGAYVCAQTTLRLYVEINGQEFYCGQLQKNINKDRTNTPKILALLCACFASAQVAHYALNLPAGRVSKNGVEVDFSVWPGVPLSAWECETDVGKCQLAGAGAVGNAILFALQYLPIRGNIAVIDPKPVTSGIIGRCLWFESDDIGDSKAIVLARKANAAFKDVAFVPFEMTVQKARGQMKGEMDCLLVGVDSRGARRQLQGEIPFEVFDASTTGVEEVVFHHNRLSADRACLACIYFETDAERKHISHVAEMLNVTNEDFAEGYISESAARKIVDRYPDLNPADIVGTAFDSLFSQLCATEKLITAEQKQVLAPFSFVSQLAGTVQAIELFLRRQAIGRGEAFNYWRINPWRGISGSLQQVRPRKSDCSVCSDEQYRELLNVIWSAEEN